MVCRVVAYNMWRQKNHTYMKSFKTSLLALLLTGAVTVSLTAAADAAPKPKPYPLKTCVVSGEKLGGDRDDPYVFVYMAQNAKDAPGREIEFCCKDVRKYFCKD